MASMSVLAKMFNHDDYDEYEKILSDCEDATVTVTFPNHKKHSNLRKNYQNLTKFKIKIKYLNIFRNIKK
jgi:hypothetical protein